MNLTSFYFFSAEETLTQWRGEFFLRSQLTWTMPTRNLENYSRLSVILGLPFQPSLVVHLHEFLVEPFEHDGTLLQVRVLHVSDVRPADLYLKPTCRSKLWFIPLDGWTGNIVKVRKMKPSLLQVCMRTNLIKVQKCYKNFQWLICICSHSLHTSLLSLPFYKSDKPVKQESILVGCVPPACWPYPVASHVSRGWGGLPPPRCRLPRAGGRHPP